MANSYRRVSKLKEGLREAEGTSDALSEGRRFQGLSAKQRPELSFCPSCRIWIHLDLMQVARGHLEDNGETKAVLRACACHQTCSSNPFLLLEDSGGRGLGVTLESQTTDLSLWKGGPASQCSSPRPPNQL